MIPNSIPSEEEFDRASRIMQERSRKLDEVRTAVLRRFKPRCQLHEFFILDQRDVDFRAYTFFETNREAEMTQNNGIHEEIIEFVYSELKRVGRGDRSRIKVAFEFDSHENVSAKFEGDYYLRLR